MANIRISRKSRTRYKVTVDEYPDILFEEKSYVSARNKAVEAVKEKIKEEIPEPAGKEEKKKIAFGIVA